MTETSKYAGAVYDPAEDESRLDAQIVRIHECMKDEQWRTLQEIADSTGDPPSSVSAQLRHLRKKRFGSHVVDKRSRGIRSGGLFEYRVLPPGSASEHPPVPRKHACGPFLAGMMFAAKTVLAAGDYAEAKKALRYEITKAAMRHS